MDNKENKVPEPKANIMHIPAYVPGKHSIKGVDDVIILSSNENPLGCSTRVHDVIPKVALHRYPSEGSNQVIEAIADVHGLDPNRILCGAGSDEILQMLVLAHVGQGDEVLYPEYGFLMYPIQTRVAMGTPVKVKETNYVVDVDALLAGITDKTKMIMFANPANPTGTVLPKAELIRLIENTPSHILIVLDGAYAEYCTWDGYTTGVDLVDTYENVVMTRTFSKAYGLASMRLGWCYAHPRIIDVLHRVRGPFNITSISQAVGAVAVKDQDFIQHSVAHNAKWLQVLTQAFVQKGCQVPPSHTNFILVLFNSAECANTAMKVLEQYGVLVRSVAGYGIENGVRITIGTDAENKRILEVMQEMEF